MYLLVAQLGFISFMLSDWFGKEKTSTLCFHVHFSDGRKLELVAWFKLVLGTVLL